MWSCPTLGPLSERGSWGGACQARAEHLWAMKQFTGHQKGQDLKCFGWFLGPSGLSTSASPTVMAWSSEVSRFWTPLLCVAEVSFMSSSCRLGMSPASHPSLLRPSHSPYHSEQAPFARRANQPPVSESQVRQRAPKSQR